MIKINKIIYKTNKTKHNKHKSNKYIKTNKRPLRVNSMPFLSISLPLPLPLLLPLLLYLLTLPLFQTLFIYLFTRLPMAPLEGELLYVTDAKELKEVCERLKGDGTKDSVCILVSTCSILLSLCISIYLIALSFILSFIYLLKGLDCEWTPSFQKGQADNNRTAVIQLSSESLNVVFHVSAFLPVCSLSSSLSF